VLFPGATVLARAVASARDRAGARLHRTLAEAVTDEQRDRLEELLEVPVYEQLSRVEELRAGPRRLTAGEVAEAFERLAAVRAVGVGQLTSMCRRSAAGAGPLRPGRQGADAAGA
jgi:hypothetical protein